MRNNESQPVEIDGDGNKKGQSPDNAYSWYAAIRDDFFGNRVANEVGLGILSDFNLAARRQNVEESSNLSLNRLKQAWAGTSDVYDT